MLHMLSLIALFCCRVAVVVEAVHIDIKRTAEALYPKEAEAVKAQLLVSARVTHAVLPRANIVAALLRWYGVVWCVCRNRL